MIAAETTASKAELSLEDYSLQIRGSTARNILMQKLLHKSEVKLVGNYTTSKKTVRLQM